MMFTVLLTLCGCAVGGGENADHIGGSDGPTSVFLAVGGQEQDAGQTEGQTEDQSEDAVDWQPGGEDGGAVQEEWESNAPVYACFDTTVINMENGDILFRSDDPRSGGSINSFTPQAAGSDGMLFVLTKQEDNYVLTAVGRETGGSENAGREDVSPELPTQVIDTIPAGDVNGFILGYYQGKCYLLYEWYHPAKGYCLYSYCYERQSDGSFVKGQDTLCETCMELQDQGYEFCGREQDVFTCLNEQDFLLVWKKEESKVFAFGTDATLCWERSIDPEIMYIRGTDGRFLIGAGGSSPENERNYYVYDLSETNTDKEPMLQGSYDAFGIDYMGLHDGYVYYRYREEWAYRHDNYSIYRALLAPAGEEELLYEMADVPGMPPDSFKAGDGFGVFGELCYFIGFDDGSLWWYSCDLTDGTHPITRLGLVKEYTGLFDVGEISYESGEYVCPDCKEAIDYWYVEELMLSENVVPHADVINPVLSEDAEMFLASVESQKETMVSCHSDGGCDDCFWISTFTGYVEGTTQYSFRQAGREAELTCLEVDYSGYWYEGGAHPMPFRDHYFFNLADGSELSIGDIVCVSEEEFRVLAAEYTVEDCRVNPGIYFYDEDGNSGNRSLYDDVYKYIGFDKSVYYLSKEGVVIEYSPYHLGSFASGYIEVTIPYEELGLELLGCYGMGKTWY